MSIAHPITYPINIKNYNFLYLWPFVIRLLQFNGKQKKKKDR